MAHWVEKNLPQNMPSFEAATYDSCDNVNSARMSQA